jgi:hypothetical protein
LRAVYHVDFEIAEIANAAGEKHWICLPSFALQARRRTRLD